MKQFETLFRWFVFSMLVISGCSYAQAQEISFKATASANKIGNHDQVQVTYTIENVHSQLSYAAPNFKDFVVVAGPQQMQSSNTSIYNGRMVQSTSFSIVYVLQPLNTGKLTIPPASVKDAEGHTYQSNAVSVQVVKGSVAQVQQQAYDPFADDPFFQDPFAQLRQRQANQQQRRQQQQQQQQQIDAQVSDMNDLKKNLFIKVQVDKEKVHVGEQVTAYYKLYTRMPMQMQISKLPSLNGFWTQDFQLPKELKPEEETVNGKKYQVFTLKKSALFPQETGTLTLDPAEADGIARTIQQVQQQNPFADMFDDPFFQQAFGGTFNLQDPFFNNGAFNSIAYKDIPVHLKSTPVKITVTPLPEKDKPANYGNAVGNFTITGKLDKTELTTDDAATFTLNITGTGNLKLIEAPALQLQNGLSTYDPQIIDTITGRTTTISGSKIITYPITPNTPGDYEIPAIPFSYFNPQSGSYVTLHTEPIKLHVKPGKNYNPALAQNNKAIMDLHPIDTKPLPELSFNSKPLLYNVGYWSMYGAPLLAFIGLLAWKRRDEELSKDVVKLKHRKANKIALKRLTTAQKLLKEQKHSAFYEEVSKAIWLYLSDKLNIPLSALSRESAEEALTKRNIPANLQEQMNYVINDCETALYTPSGGSQQMNRTYEQAIEVISKLEETFKS